MFLRSLSIVVALAVTLAACRGEPPPRDYQNAPPAMTDPPATKSEAPATAGQGQPSPEPSTGVEGKAEPYKPVTPPSQPTTTTMEDTKPVTTTT